MLGEESNAPVDYVVERLVRTDNLPARYVISEERIQRSKELDSVQVQCIHSDAQAKAEWVAAVKAGEVEEI